MNDATIAARHDAGRFLFSQICRQKLSTQHPAHSTDGERDMAVVIELPDGSRREVPEGSTVAQLAESIGRGLAKAAVAGRVDGKVVDLSHAFTPGEHKVSILTDRDPDGLL